MESKIPADNTQINLNKEALSLNKEAINENEEAWRALQSGEDP